MVQDWLSYFAHCAQLPKEHEVALPDCLDANGGFAQLPEAVPEGQPHRNFREQVPETQVPTEHHLS